MFLSRNKKNNVYPCEPYTILKWGLRGLKLYRYVFVMSSWCHWYVLFCRWLWLFLDIFYTRERTTKPTIRPVRPANTQISLHIHLVWQGVSFTPLWIAWMAHAISEDCDQTARMRCLILVFAGRTITIASGSYLNSTTCDVKKKQNFLGFFCLFFS